MRSLHKEATAILKGTPTPQDWTTLVTHLQGGNLADWAPARVLSAYLLVVVLRQQVDQIPPDILKAICRNCGYAFPIEQGEEVANKIEILGNKAVDEIPAIKATFLPPLLQGNAYLDVNPYALLDRGLTVLCPDYLLERMTRPFTSNPCMESPPPPVPIVTALSHPTKDTTALAQVLDTPRLAKHYTQLKKASASEALHPVLEQHLQLLAKEFVKLQIRDVQAQRL